MLVINDHKIDGIDYIPSPNCEERPKNFFPEIIVIHAISPVSYTHLRAHET